MKDGIKAIFGKITAKNAKELKEIVHDLENKYGCTIEVRATNNTIKSHREYEYRNWDGIPQWFFPASLLS